jgi:hypothetical protein
MVVFRVEYSIRKGIVLDLKASLDRQNNSKIFFFKERFDLTFISSMINHFDVNRLFSCVFLSVDSDAVEFNVVELVTMEFG